MRKFFPTITAILLGLVFLLAGASTSKAANETYIYYYQFKTDSAESTRLQLRQFSTMAECQASHSTAPSFNLTPCSQTLQVAIDALIKGEEVRLANLKAARARTPEEDAIFKNLNCNPVGSVIGGLFGGEGTLVECIPVVTYYIIYKPASWLLIGSGFVFDAMLTLSIDGSFINQDFVLTLWSVVRDFSNMLFIFILIFAGVQTIIGAGNWRKTVLFVVMMALLINFSLFFTKVVIDAGNVLAVAIYNSMGTPKPTEFQSFQSPGAVPERDISGSLAGAFQPQSFLSTAGKVDALDATIVFLIAAFISGYAGYIFFKAALLFIGRLIAFWFLMIVSPFAFISIALPSSANKFNEWVDTLISQSFMAPVFLFLIYLIMKVIGAGGGILESLIKSSGSTASAFTFDKVLAPVVIAAMLMLALDQAYSFSKKMAGHFGEIGSNALGAVMGTVGGLALGAAGLAGRGIGGRLAQSLYEKGTFAKMATGESALGRFAGRQLIGINEAARTGTWDARGVGLMQQAAKKTGLDIGKPGEGAKGGFEGVMKRQDQADKKFAEKLKMTEMEKASVIGDTKGKQASAEKATKDLAEGIKKLEKALEGEQKAEGGSATAIAAVAAKVAYEKAVNQGNPAIISAAKETLEQAEATHAASPESIAVKSTLNKIKEMGEAQKKAEEELKTAKEKAEEAQGKVDEEEARRREAYAQHIEGRAKIAGVSTATTLGAFAAGPAGAAIGYGAGIFAAAGTYSNEQAQRTAAKIRKGGADAKPSDEGKALKELVKKLKEEQEKEGK